MTKSVFTVYLSKSAGKDMKPYIEQIISPDDRSMRTRVMVTDSEYGSGGGGNNVLSYIFEFIQNKDVCYTFAAIVIAWIRARNGRSVTIKKGDTVIHAKGLTEKELAALLAEKDSKIHIDSKG